MSSRDAVTVVNNEMSHTREKRSNLQEQGVNLFSNSRVEDRQQLSCSENSPEPGLVEKLMQQLNDLKEMVCIYSWFTSKLFFFG